MLARFAFFAMSGVTAIGLLVGAVIAFAPRREAEPTQTVVGNGVVAEAPVAPEVQRLQPSIPEGRSPLGDSIVAERRGDDVTVHFDTQQLRTRFDAKFERVVRATLPLVYGSDAGAALDSIRDGDFVRGGHLLVDLPTKGIQVALSDGRSLIVKPITRPGQDGPLVVGYSAAPTRN